MTNEDVDEVLKTLSEATAKVTKPFIQVPVAGKEDPEYRERVYAYELYHQLRGVWPPSLSRYSLSGEVDEAGHPLIRSNVLDRAKPDLIVHVPRDMNVNLAVVEIKAWLPGNSKIRHDVEKLDAFCDNAK